MPVYAFRDPKTGEVAKYKFRFKTVEEQHPDVGFFDRLMAKGWNFHPNQAVRELQESGLQVERDDDGRLIVKKQDEREWRFVDPKHFGIWEMVKDALDVSSDVHQVAMESVGALGGAALMPAHPLAGASAGSAYWGGLAKTMRGGVGSLANLNAPTPGEALAGVGTEAGIAAMVPSVAKGASTVLKPVAKALAPVGKAFRESKIVRSVLPKMTKEMTEEANELGLYKFAAKYDIRPVKGKGKGMVERPLAEIVDEAVKAQPGYKDYIARMIGSSRYRDVGSVEQARSMIPDEPVTFSATEVGKDAMRKGKGGMPYEVTGKMRPEVVPNRPGAYMDEFRGRHKAGIRYSEHQPVKLQASQDYKMGLNPSGRKFVASGPIKKVVHITDEGMAGAAKRMGIGQVKEKGGEKYWKKFTDRQIAGMSPYQRAEFMAKTQRGYVGNVKGGPGTYSRPAAGVHSVLAPPGSTVDPSNWTGVAHRGLTGVASPSMGAVDLSKPSFRKLAGAGAYAISKGLQAPMNIATGILSKAARKAFPAHFGHLSPWAVTGALGGGAFFSPTAGVLAGSFGAGKVLEGISKLMMRDISGITVMRILASKIAPKTVQFLADNALQALREGGVAKYRVALHALLSDPIARKWLNDNAAELGLPQEPEEAPQP